MQQCYAETHHAAVAMWGASAPHQQLTLRHRQTEPPPSACSRRARRLGRRSRRSCCPAPPPLRHSALRGPSLLPQRRPPASATATRRDRTGGPVARAGCTAATGKHDQAPCDRPNMERNSADSAARRLLDSKICSANLRLICSHPKHVVHAAHPSTAWSCSWMSGCGSRCTARTGCRRTAHRLVRDGVCTRRPAISPATLRTCIGAAAPLSRKHARLPREHMPQRPTRSREPPRLQRNCHRHEPVRGHGSRHGSAVRRDGAAGIPIARLHDGCWSTLCSTIDGAGSAWRAA